jgi:hypothetical protein
MVRNGQDIAQYGAAIAAALPWADASEKPAAGAVEDHDVVAA